MVFHIKLSHSLSLPRTVQRARGNSAPPTCSGARDLNTRSHLIPRHFVASYVPRAYTVRARECRGVVCVCELGGCCANWKLASDSSSFISFAFPSDNAQLSRRAERLRHSTFVAVVFWTRFRRGTFLGLEPKIRIEFRVDERPFVG